MNETKEKILHASLHLFAKYGYDAVSTADIASGLGITKPALYKHYKSKEDIFQSILSRMEEYDRRYTEESGMDSVELTPDIITEFSKKMFCHWTEDEFASDFRRMLTIEQYGTEEKSQLYHQYLGAGPVEYLSGIFSEMLNTDRTEAYKKAVSFYSAMHLCYSLHDSEPDKVKVKTAAFSCIEKSINEIFEKDPKKQVDRK